ncbi:MAG: deoxyribose-phosphate aldolase [Clostridium sp.]|jgi:deoxyribose-phosphate aldolase|nr:deoxyribose-phosphate aldolase [Clostridium sp.]
MEMKEILAYVDHTALKPTASWEDVRRLCEEAVLYGTASVCIPPCYVERVKQLFGEKVRICTVVGFPLGYQTTRVKVAETRDAIEKGAAEVDMVVNLADVKNAEFEKVTQEIAALKKAAGSHILKVIVEACYLTEEEKISLCRAVTRAGADYIKTSTGFGTGGARLEDVRLFRRHIGKDVKIKAAGGIRTKAEMEAFLREGCDRIGSSGAVALAGEGA